MPNTFLTLKVEKLKDDNIAEVACHVFESDYKLEPQHCLVCDSYRDLESSCAAISQTENCCKRYDRPFHLSCWTH